MKGCLWTLLIASVIAITGVWILAFQQSQEDPFVSNKVAENDKPIVESIQPAGETTYHSTASVYVPILMYHYIRAGVDPNDRLGIALSVSPEKLRSQLTTLKESGYESISLSQFAQKKYQAKSVVITFDDGYADSYEQALPVLNELKMTATFFIVRDFIGRPGYLTQEQITKMQKAGMEIGGHSLSHKNLTKVEYESQVADISASMRGYSQVFCYPSGKYSEVTLDIVSGLKVNAAVTTIYGIATDQSKIYELPRIRMVENTDILKRIKEETAIAKKQLAPSQRTND